MVARTENTVVPQGDRFGLESPLSYIGFELNVAVCIESEYLGGSFYPIHNSKIVPRIYL